MGFRWPERVASGGQKLGPAPVPSRWQCVTVVQTSLRAIAIDASIAPTRNDVVLYCTISDRIMTTMAGTVCVQDAFTTAIASNLASDLESPLYGLATSLTWHRQRAGLAAALNVSNVKDPNFM